MMKRGGGIRNGGDTEVLRLTHPASADELGSIRSAVRDFLGARGAGPELVDDFELAVSELATNVLRHTDSESISVVVKRTDSEWVLDVADAERVPPLDTVELPAPTETTGRGLFVVMSVMDDVGVATVEGAQVVRCVRSIAS
jgi:serine/threonine-protein kinase RsbW